MKTIPQRLIDSAEQPTRYSMLRHAVNSLAVGVQADPMPHDITAVAPHLTEDAARYLLKEAKATGRIKFAGPPITRMDTYQVYCLHHANEQMRFYRACAYAAKGPGAYTGSEQLWANDAMAYAAQYGQDMFAGYAPFVVQVELVNIANLDKDRKPAAIAMCCNASLEYLLTCYDEEPLSELLDDAIQLTVSGPAALDEMALGATKSWIHFCGACGAGINREGCMHCPLRGNIYESGRRMYPATIPRSLHKYVTALGHKFAHDPRVPRAREHQVWASKQLTGVVESSTRDYKAPRMIDMGHSCS